MRPTLPRVTEILRAVGLAPDYSAVPEAVLEAARLRGTARHEAIAADHYGYLEVEQEPLLGGYRKFLADTGHVPRVSEGLVTHAVWGYVGHLDRIGCHGQDLAVVEWKPWNVDLARASYQLASYRAAREHMVPSQPIPRGIVVELTDDDYRMTDVTLPDPSPAARWPGLDAAWSVFQGALIVYRAQHR